MRLNLNRVLAWAVLLAPLVLLGGCGEGAGADCTAEPRPCLIPDIRFVTLGQPGTARIEVSPGEDLVVFECVTDDDGVTTCAEIEREGLPDWDVRMTVEPTVSMGTELTLQLEQGGEPEDGPSQLTVSVVVDGGLRGFRNATPVRTVVARDGCSRVTQCEYSEFPRFAI